MDNATRNALLELARIIGSAGDSARIEFESLEKDDLTLRNLKIAEANACYRIAKKICEALK